ncbi:hypothetical protein TUM4438_35020 [Shewanella sairae]|uniref:Uncharacterized protein n=1 Tax=Shewanella sairae TaxID=190310 RepID=A0ABQ4PNJ9_9GAMM|nr:hypothetical protein [Shewanella sairae]GIU50069.1 hypothetical protein TUM4438_35020 [Shewanella sairae]
MSQLVAFLHSLTDSCLAEGRNSDCLTPWIPLDPDGLRLEAVMQ